MDIILGRGGNQAADLSGAGVAPAHCIISSEGTYHTVKPTSVSPTFVDGERVWTTKGETFTPDCQITVGEFTAPIAEIVKPMNVAEITDWGIASRRLKDTNAAGAFLDITVYEYFDGDEENGGADYVFLWDNIAACKALHLIDEGKLRAAQELLYEAGDDLYASQDGSMKLKGAYASVLVLLGKLYIAAGREDAAREALAGARKVFAAGVECSEEVSALLNSLRLQ